MQLKTMLTRLGRARLLAISAAAMFGGSTVLSKFALESFPPMTLLLVQLLGSLCVLWLFLLISRRQVPMNFMVLKRAATGILEPAMTYMFSFFGLTLTTASQTALISTLETVMIMILSVVIFRAPVEKRLFGLAILATLGAMMVVGTTSGSNALVGNLLVVLGTACAALYVVLNQHPIPQLEPSVMIGLQQLVGLIPVIMVTIFIWLSGGKIMPEGLAWWDWGLAALIGVAQYAIGFSLYFTAQRDLTSNETALYLTLIPVFGVAGGAIFLGERLQGLQWLGATMIIGAITFITWSSHHNTDSQT